MVGWPVVGVAGLAVGGVGGLVVEVCRAPGARVVAARALPGVMVGGPVIGVAGLAVGSVSNLVIESCRLPGLGVVTGGTQT